MQKQSGFTLTEMMVTIAIIGLLTAIALPAYRNYVTTSRLTDAFSNLAAAQSAAEQFWSNNRTYVGFDGGTSFPQDNANFSYAMTGETTSTYTITATGVGGSPVAGFIYTIDQNGNRTTVSTPEWGSSATCWINKQGGACVQ